MAELPRSPREEVLDDVRSHLATLNARLDELQALGVTVRPDDIDRELVYIDRAAGAAPKAVRREIDGEVEQVRKRVTALKRKNVGFALADIGGGSSESLDSGSAGQHSFMRGRSGGSLRSQKTGPVSQRSFMQKVQTLKTGVSIRSWKSVDDEHEQRAFVDLAGQAAGLREVAAEVAVHIDNDQQKLDHVAEETSNTKENVRAAVSSVSDAAQSQMRRWNFIGLAVALLVTIVGVLVAWSTDGNVALPIVVGVAIGVLVHLAAMVGKNAQAKGMDAVKDRVQEASSWPPLSADAAERIYREGLEGEIRLLELLDASWGRPEQLTADMQLTQRQRQGRAFRVTFEVRLDASVAFRMVDRLRNAGGLDPGCQAMWRRPVDNAGTSLRYSVHDIWFANRDFLTVCRSAPVSTQDGRNQYLLAATSLSPDLCDIVETERRGRWMTRGEVRALGVSVEDLTGASAARLSSTWPMEAGNCRCRVDVVVDVDARLCCCAGGVARRHAIAISQQISSMFAAAAESRLAGSVELREF